MGVDLGAARAVLAGAARIEEAPPQCARARHVIHRMMHHCLPRHPPHDAPLLATSSTA
jgi:hypothetical protein